MTVGDRIKVLREKMCMPQVEFADKIGVSKQTLYKYENNIITNIPSDKIELAAKLCNVPPAFLMGWQQTGSINMPVMDGENVVELIKMPITESLDDKEFLARANKQFVTTGITPEEKTVIEKYRSADNITKAMVCRALGLDDRRT